MLIIFELWEDILESTEAQMASKKQAPGRTMKVGIMAVFRRMFLLAFIWIQVGTEVQK